MLVKWDCKESEKNYCNKKNETGMFNERASEMKKKMNK